MLQTFKNGQGSIVLRVKLLDSTATTGAGKTGLTSSSSGLIISTIADNEASATVYTQAGSTIEAVTTLGTYAAPTATKCRFKEVDATNHKGIYEIQIADARFAVSSAKSLLVSVSGVTGMAEADFVVQLQSDDPYVAKPTNYASLVIDGSGRVDVSKIAGTSQTARDIGASVLLSTGTGTGQLDFTSGVVKANVTQYNGSSATSASGRPEVNVTHWLGTAASTPTVAGVPNVNVKTWNDLATVALPLVPTTAGRTLDVSTTGEAGIVSAEIADAVWDELLSGHAVSGSTGEALSASGAAGDPWITALPGAYSSGQAGYIVGTNLNATVSSRATQTSVDTIDDYIDTEVAAIKAKTDLIPASPAAVGDIPTATENADALLNRDMSAVSDSESRSPLNALRFIRNGFSISGSTLTVLKEDDTTPAYTRTLTTDAAADPIVGVD